MCSTAAGRRLPRNAEVTLGPDSDLRIGPLSLEIAVKSASAMDGTTPADVAKVDSMLETLVDHEHLLRIKIWSKDGTVLFSDLPALRGKQFEVDDDLGKAFDGKVTQGLSDKALAQRICATRAAMTRGMPARSGTTRSASQPASRACT